MISPAPRLVRDELTWLVYLVYGFYGALINGLGPSLVGLRADLGLTHAEASLHSSLFAVGLLVAGLGGDTAVRAVGRRRTVWVAAAGMTLATLAFVLARALPVTLLCSLVMGTTGSLMVVLVPAILSDRHGQARSAAISEANSVASAMGAAAPLLVGVSIAATGDWRAGLLASTALVVPLLAARRHVRFPEPGDAGKAADPGHSLPAAYWAQWATIVLVVSVEFCMVYWTSDFLRERHGLDAALASAAVTLFLIGMVVGRAAIGQLVLRLRAARLLLLGLALTLCGFAAFWLAPDAAVALAGVLVTGLGVASLYPLTLGMALEASGGATDRASSRAALASGLAVLGGPLVLAALADAGGIAAAYGIVPLLVLGAWLVQLAARRLPVPRPTGPGVAAG